MSRAEPGSVVDAETSALARVLAVLRLSLSLNENAFSVACTCERSCDNPPQVAVSAGLATRMTDPLSVHRRGERGASLVRSKSTITSPVPVQKFRGRIFRDTLVPEWY